MSSEADRAVTSVEPGCTCGGMAACPQCQGRDAEAQADRLSEAPVSDALTDAEWRELVAAAVEMSRKAKQEQQRAEEAEFHVEQLRDALDSAERIGERAAELATERDAALARIARTERLIDSWERDAPDHSNPVFIGRLRECLRRDPAPVRLRGDECEWCNERGTHLDGCRLGLGPGESCDHHWLDRPESDTRECLICGTEVAG